MADVDALYRQYGHVVLRRARAILGNDDEAREVLQELFLSLIGSFAAFEGRSSITTWLYAATTHMCLNRIRNQKTRARLLEAWHRDPEPTLSPEAEHVTGLREILGALPRELAEVVVYYHHDGMTHDEIAGILGCSRRHVGNLLERAQSAAQAEARSA